MSDPIFSVIVEVEPTTAIVEVSAPIAAIVEVGIQGPPGVTGPPGPAGLPGNAVNRYSSTFSESDLSLLGILVKIHSLGVTPIVIRIIDPNGESVEPDDWSATATTASIDFSTIQPLTPGIWEIHLF